MTSSIVTRSQAAKRLYEENKPEPKRKKREEESLEKVIEMLRDDAYFEAHQRIKPLIARSFEAKLLDKPLPNISRQHKQIVTEIARNKSTDCADSLKELYHILESSRYTRNYKCIVNFALEIIQALPDIEKEQIIISEEAKHYAQSAKEKFPFDLPEDVIAIAFQKALDGKEVQTITEEQERAIKQLGTLLLVTQRDVKFVFDACQQENFDDTMKMLNQYKNNLFDQALEAMDAHYLAHKKTAIQGEKEALFHKMSLEMADILLLDTGSINVGILEDVSNSLVPEEFEEIEAIKNLYIVLNELRDNPLIGNLLAHAAPPKNPDLPSNGLIRNCLRLLPNDTITKRHVQIVILSALLGHMRQAKAGTCFATAHIIQAFFNHIPMVVSDFIELLQESKLTRVLHQEERSLPIQLRLSKEYLDTKISCSSKGRIHSIKRFARVNLNNDQKSGIGSYLYESPGLVNVCYALKLTDPKQALLTALSGMEQPVTPKELISALAKQAFAIQEMNPFYLRSTEKLTLEQMIDRGLYAFGAETNHPLHRAYEQTIACSVDYFGSQYAWGAWLHCSLKETLEHKDKNYPPNFQHKYRNFIKEIFLPILTRARFIYNHHIDDYEPLFNAKARECNSHTNFGYELCISPLPSDFKYSKKLYDEYHSEVSYFHLTPFKGYPPAHTWKKIETEQDYIEFLIDVVNETLSYKKSQAKQDECKLLEQVAQKIITEIRQKNFIKKMIINIFGHGYSQKKNFLKNEHTVSTTPWKFRWGGDPNAVQKAFFGFSKKPSRSRPFSGTALEVLAKTINFVRKMPADIQESLQKPNKPLVICSPRHAFLLTPSETSFQEAVQSMIEPTEYIQSQVISPGIEIANKELSTTVKNEVISYVANSVWYHPSMERHDYEQQQLTDESKKAFDILLQEQKELFTLSTDLFIKELINITCVARKQDPRIGKRNPFWDQTCTTAINNKYCQLSEISDRDLKAKLVDFARNRKDTRAFSEEGKAKFLHAMDQLRKNLSVQEFREALVQTAQKIHDSDLCCKDKEWKGIFCEYLDTFLFSKLPEKWQQISINHGIITHDMNWKQEVHNYLGMFMVNPCTGKLELVSYIPDKDKVVFMKQKDWFNKKPGWSFPSNYLAYESSPELFDYKKLLGVE